MIDATKFSSTFTAFWNMATPTCEHLVRKINLNLFERQDVGLISPPHDQKALVAEYGFALFSLSRFGNMAGPIAEAHSDEALDDARKRISRLRGEHGKKYELTPDQLSEGREIANRLFRFFFGSRQLIVRPSFPGCGFVDRSEGDVWSEATLFEVKAVDRPFRSNDLRQLIVYAALNSLRSDIAINGVGVYNPRRGLYFRLPLNFVAREISGRHEADLFEDVVQAISNNGVSR